MQIQFKKLNADARIPARQTPGAAGFDLHLCAHSPWVIYPGEIHRYMTGIAAAIPEGYVGLIRDRSGLASKGLTVLGGVIDSDYRGEIQVMLTYLGDPSDRGSIVLSPGDRIAQLVVVQCVLDSAEVADLADTERGADGFGSSGA